MRLLRRSPFQLPRRRPILVLALLVAAGCDLIDANPHAALLSRVAEFDVQEAALRWAFANTDTDLRPPAIHCLGLGHGGPDLVDPSDTLVARFAADPVLVRAVSYCDGPLRSGQGRDSHPGVELDRHFIFHPQTGQPGLLFILHPVEWDATGNAAELGITFVQGSLWGAVWICTAQRVEGSNWRILDCTKAADI